MVTFLAFFYNSFIFAKVHVFPTLTSVVLGYVIIGLMPQSNWPHFFLGDVEFDKIWCAPSLNDQQVPRCSNMSSQGNAFISSAVSFPRGVKSHISFQFNNNSVSSRERFLTGSLILMVSWWGTHRCLVEGRLLSGQPCTVEPPHRKDSMFVIYPLRVVTVYNLSTQGSHLFLIQTKRA